MTINRKAIAVAAGVVIIGACPTVTDAVLTWRDRPEFRALILASYTVIILAALALYKEL